MAEIKLVPVEGCECTEPHPDYFTEKRFRASAEQVADIFGKMFCARDGECLAMHPVAAPPQETSP